MFPSFSKRTELSIEVSTRNGYGYLCTHSASPCLVCVCAQMCTHLYLQENYTFEVRVLLFVQYVFFIQDFVHHVNNFVPISKKNFKEVNLWMYRKKSEVKNSCNFILLFIAVYNHNMQIVCCYRYNTSIEQKKESIKKENFLLL